MKKIIYFINICIISLFTLFLSSCVMEEKYENSFDKKTYQAEYKAWKDLNINHYFFTLSGPFNMGKGYSYSITLEIKDDEVISREYPIPEIVKSKNKDDEYLQEIQNIEPYKSIKSIDDFFDFILINYTEMTENPQPVHCYVSYDKQYHFPKETTFRRFYEKTSKDYETGGRSDSSTYYIKEFKILSD